jgi:hypothetical protein
MADDLQWDNFAYAAFFDNPEGPIGDLFHRLAEIVLAGARARCEKRTGRMAAAMRFDVFDDAQGLYADVSSPVRSPGPGRRMTGFPYAVVHEGRRVRDRRPHRSLKPALNDIKKILSLCLSWISPTCTGSRPSASRPVTRPAC